MTNKPKRDYTPEQRRKLAQIVRVILTPDPPKGEQDKDSASDNTQLSAPENR
jgi:hypothetical protein